MKARKKPLVLDVIQIPSLEESTEARNDFAQWMGPQRPIGKWGLDYNHLQLIVEIHTLEGCMKAHEGDWIIRGTKGEMWPVRNDIFQDTYDLIDEEAL